MSRMSSKVSGGGGGTKNEPQQQQQQVPGGTGSNNNNNATSTTPTTGGSTGNNTSNPSNAAPPPSASSVQSGPGARTKGSSIGNPNSNQIQNLSSQKESNNNNTSSTNNNSSNKSISSSKSVPQNNQSKSSSSSSKPHSSSSKSKSSSSKAETNSSSSSGLPPPAPSSSPVPPPPSSTQLGGGGEEDEDEDDLEIEIEECDAIDIVDDLEAEDGDLDDEEDYDQDDGDPEDEDPDEDDENPLDLELDGHDDLTEPCERSLPGGGGPANNSASSYNSPNFLGTSSEEEEDDEGEADESLEREELSVSDEEEDDDEDGLEPTGFLLPPDGDSAGIQGIPPDAQARLEAFFEAAGFTDGKLMSDPENLRKLTLTVSSALGEASAAINRMRDSQRKSMEEGRNDSMEEGDSLLALACSSGYFELARVLLAMGANVDDRGSKGDLTPLMDAASQGHLEIVRLLLSHGADVNAQSSCGNSPLMYACAAGHEDIVKELLKSGGRVEDNNENGHTPLMEAASAGHVGVAKILLDHGAGINTHSNEFKESALTVACYKGHLEMVRFLLEAGADQQHKTDEMHTALMEASMDGHVEVARLLLDSGAQVNMPADSFESPLTLAACGGHVELAELLIERGANIEEVNDEGYTPLMEAAREGHLAVVKCLLKNGAKINAQTEETHETALTLAACGGFLDVVDTLCNDGADIELGASTPLMEASQEGHYQVVKYLLDRGADITKQTQTGDTALSYACENGHVDVVELLIQKGADPEHLSEGGRTPLMKACRGGHLDVIKYLLGRGADVNRQTASNDHTPLSLACAGGHIAAVEVLLAAGANPFHKLKDGSTMIIEAARGGHTSVIRALLDYPPREKQQSQGGAPSGTSKQPQLKAAPIPAKSQQVQAADKGQSTSSTATQSQNKSVLRKSRSTSTLEPLVAAQQQQQKQSTGNEAGSNQGSDGGQPVAKVKQQSQTGGNHNQASDAQLKNFNVPLADGKVSVSTISPSKGEPGTAGTGNVPPRKTASTSVNPAHSGSTEVCNTCSSGSGAIKQGEGHLHGHHPTTPQQQHHNVKRPAASESGTIASTTSNSSGSGVLVSPVSPPAGPPLIPSQVTAATAISERPKAKANKPSARKQVLLQQQLLQQQQQQQQQGNTNQSSAIAPAPGTLVSPVVTAASSSGGIVVPAPAQCTGMLMTSPQAASAESLRSQAAAANAAVLSQAAGLKIGPVSADAAQQIVGSPAFLQMQVQQILTHHPSQYIYKGEKKALVDAAGHYEPLSLVEGTPTEMIDFTQVLAGAYGASTGSTGQIPLGTVATTKEQVGTATTTTTTTVVVTHGNGETETIIDGDLPPGANEMIMSAAAAAFPIDCFPGITTTGTGGVDGVGGQVQVQSYQLTSPATLASDMTPLTTTTMHTTTIINSSGTASASFQPQILLPHPPPLPQAIAAAAAAAGLIPPTGAPPEGPLRQLQQQQPHQPQPAPQQQKQAIPASTTNKGQINKEKCVQQQASSTTKPSSQVSSTSSGQVQQQHGPVAVQSIPKKHVAKRSRPFSQQQQQHPVSSAKGQSHSVASTQTTPTAADKSSNARALDVDSATESNGETSLSIAAASGHYEVVEFLIGRKAHIEHRDKKGYTPLILAADGGHDKVTEFLLNNGSDMEAQSERTKDTALSLACTKGRYEVVELLLKRGANKEHRNVSDYTPLSLAASGGYVNIIKLLLTHGAEINSRTGSKLGISPLMLAAMNGNTAAVKLLLDMGSDINAQIETNKNTALTLACFQGRHEVVQLLLERKANLEHRAKTGLTPLMEAANGGYVEVGKILIEKGAEVNAAPVPATRDTALTIAADKGHYRFVELLLNKGAIVDARNKKGCTPLWLACHGGHLDVGQILFRHRADLDAQDNRKISCLMAAFRKGHVKVIRWIVKNVQQFPSDLEMSRYMMGLQSEPDLHKRCAQCAEYIKQAKDKQAHEANKNANVLLQELEQEKSREESKRLAAQRRRDKKKEKKKAKKQANSGGPDDDDDDDDDDDQLRNKRGGLDDDDDDDEEIVAEVIDSGIDANSLGSNSSATQAESNRHPGNQSKGKGKENQQQKHQPPQPVPPQKSASSKSVSSSTSAATATPPIPDVLEEPPSASQQKSSSKSSRKKKNKSSKNNASNSNNVESKVDMEPNEGLKNISNSISNTSIKSTSKENQTSKPAPAGGNFVSTKTSTAKGSSGDNVLREKVEVDLAASNKGSANKKDKKNRGEPEQVQLQKSKELAAEAPHLTTGFHPASNKLSSTSVSSAMSHGMSGASMNKKMKGGLETVPVPEPLMGISLSPSQLKKGSGGSTANTASFPSAADHESSHPSVFTSPGSVTSSSAPTAAPSGLKSGGTAGTPSGKAPGVGVRKGDDGWKEVTRNCPSSRSKKVIVPSSVISRVIGRGGCNINAIREATGAHIEVEKQQKGQVQPERTIQIKGSADATKQAHNLITALMNEPDIDVKKLLPMSGVRSSTSATSVATSVTPTPSSIGQFPVIGSVTSLLQQQQQVTSTMGVQNSSNVTPTLPGLQQSSTGTGGNSSNMTTPVDIIIPPTTSGTPSTPGTKYGPFGGKVMKGSPSNQRTILGSGSPPLTSMKSGSPPIKKPVVVSSQNQRGNNVGGNKRSGGGSIGTFAAKLVQPLQQQRMSQSQHHQDSTTWDNRQMSQRTSNATPTPIGSQTKRITPTGGIMSAVATPGTPSATPPPQVTASPSTLQTTVTNSPRSSYGIQQSGSQQVLQGMSNGPLGVGMMTNGGVETIKSIDGSDSARSSLDTTTPDQQQQAQYQPPRNLAPGSNPNSSPSTAPGSSSAPGGNRCSLDMEHHHQQQQQQRTPLEYSPFNYQFSKTAGWFPGDLAVNSNNPGGNIPGSGMQGGLSGSTASLNSSVARAIPMNSKAPGYRGSPNLRQMHQQQPPHSSVQNSPGAPFGGIAMDGPLSSHFAVAAGITTGPSGLVNFGNNPGPGVVAPPGQQRQQQVHQFGSGLHQQQLMGQQQQQFKGMGNQYPGMNRVGAGNRAVGGGSTPNHGGVGAGSGWNAYNEDALLSFAGFAALATSAGMIDGMGGVMPGMDSMGGESPMVAPPGPPKMDDRRQLPRPIGGERAWKQSSNSGAGGGSGFGAALQGFAVSPLDCIDAGPLPQPIQIPASVGGNSQQQQQNQQHWLGGLYPQSTSSGSGYPSQQPPPPLNLGNHGPHNHKGSGGLLGRRVFDETDGRGIMELQQQFYDGQRMLNGAGGSTHPHMHNMQNPPMNQQQPMYAAYGGGMDHGVDAQHTFPKVDQHAAWDAQRMMDEKSMGGWGASKWNN